MPPSPEWFRSEAAQHGLSLTDDDLAFARDQVGRVKAALAAQGWQDATELEPPYQFSPQRCRPPRAR